MTGTIRIDELGRIALPAELREAFGGTPGMPVRVEVTRGRIEITGESPEISNCTVNLFDCRLLHAPGWDFGAGSFVSCQARCALMVPVGK
jgi:AbrB family looped-hinge helix DNA binding protein